MAQQQAPETTHGAVRTAINNNATDAETRIAALEAPDSTIYDLTADPSYSKGQISYDPAVKTLRADTGYTGVRVDIGQEVHIRFKNDTVDTITNGTPLNVGGVDAATNVLKGIEADASNPALSFNVFGVATHDVLPGEIGLATQIGEVKDVKTDTFLEGGVLYLGLTPGTFTQTKPLYPNARVIIGTVTESADPAGKILVNIDNTIRINASRSYGFTSQGIGTGLYYKAGFYDWETTSVTLDQTTTTQTYGTAGRTYAAHPGIVPAASGSVDTGQVGLRVNGIKDSEEGPQSLAQSDTITDDITTLTGDLMAEAAAKFSGEVTFELYVVSGAPAAYSLTFNYGYSKYEDFQNRDATVTSVECVWQGGANDSSFDIAVKHHKPAGWTYAATGFEPGNGDIVRRSIDQAEAGDVANGQEGTWKRVNVNQFINGNDSEGVIFEVVTGANNTVQTMDMHLSAVSEEL